MLLDIARNARYARKNFLANFTSLGLTVPMYAFGRSDPEGGVNEAG